MKRETPSDIDQQREQEPPQSAQPITRHSRLALIMSTVLAATACSTRTQPSPEPPTIAQSTQEKSEDKGWNNLGDIFLRKFPMENFCQRSVPSDCSN